MRACQRYGVEVDEGDVLSFYLSSHSKNFEMTAPDGISENESAVYDVLDFTC